MLTLPSEMIALLAAFAPEFSKSVWMLAQVLLVGAILSPHKRTVTAALRAMGLSQERHFDKYHRVLNRAQWSGLRLSRILLVVLVTTFVTAGVPVLIGVDETIERRWGPKIVQRGIYRDPVRSSKSHLVKASGLRWVCLMLIVDIPWTDRAWALPFLTVLAPSKRYDEQRGRNHRTVPEKPGPPQCSIPPTRNRCYHANKRSHAATWVGSGSLSVKPSLRAFLRRAATSYSRCFCS